MLLTSARCLLRVTHSRTQCQQCLLTKMQETVRNLSTASKSIRRSVRNLSGKRLTRTQQRNLSGSVSSDGSNGELEGEDMNIVQTTAEEIRKTEITVDDKTVKKKLDHIPVMTESVLDILNPKNDQLIIDMTFGSGGHTREILKVAPEVRMICLDRDPTAFSRAEDLAKDYKPGQIIPCNGKFSDLPHFLHENNILPGSVDSFLFDVGASSMQFDVGSRGFSLSKDGPLDMRMDQDRIPNQPSAMDIVNNIGAEDLGEILKKYGEERKHKLIARNIVDARYAHGKITTTQQLAAIVKSCFPDEYVMKDRLNRRAHVATRTFQALRIFVNNELNELNVGIQLAHMYLKEGGLCVGISFHSLEDRIIKRHFHGIDLMEEKSLSLVQKIRRAGRINDFRLDEIKEVLKTKWSPLSKKITMASHEECKVNPRSRSAKLRAATKM